MNGKKPKDLGIMIKIPAELAHEVYRESGDLPYAKFPATIAISELIGKALKMDREEHGTHPQQIVSYRNKKRSITRRKYA